MQLQDYIRWHPSQPVRETESPLADPATLRQALERATRDRDLVEIKLQDTRRQFAQLQQQTSALHKKMEESVSYLIKLEEEREFIRRQKMHLAWVVQAADALVAALSRGDSTGSALMVSLRMSQYREVKERARRADELVYGETQTHGGAGDEAFSQGAVAGAGKPIDQTLPPAGRSAAPDLTSGRQPF